MSELVVPSSRKNHARGDQEYNIELLCTLKYYKIHSLETITEIYCRYDTTSLHFGIFTWKYALASS